MDLKVSMTSRLICNIGHNKIEQQTPIPPKSRMKPREGQKCAIFPSLILGEGLWFLFILSKSVGLDVKGLKWFSV